jgi:bidirectional [NiFe] hydrogenase diaphorase subunit
MSEISLMINGREVKAEEGMTVLEAARGAGIDIPTLCEHEGLAPCGSCRLCTVEIVKNKRTRLAASCVYQAEEGLQVNTETERIIKGRRMILELLTARAPGAQVLRDYGIKYGIDRKKFDAAPNHCILCGLCVRYCAEVKKKDVIGFIGRGTERAVMFFPEKAAEECSKCGECWNICPTGVLPSNYGLERVPHFSWPINPFSDKVR